MEQDKIKSKENQELVPQRNPYKKQNDFLYTVLIFVAITVLFEILFPGVGDPTI